MLWGCWYKRTISKLSKLISKVINESNEKPIIIVKRKAPEEKGEKKKEEQGKQSIIVKRRAPEEKGEKKKEEHEKKEKD
jgi:hypothetical protein